MLELCWPSTRNGEITPVFKLGLHDVRKKTIVVIMDNIVITI